MLPAMLEQMAADMRCAVDPVAFAVERLDFYPDDWQAEVLRMPGNALLNCSRQAGKSTTAGIRGLHRAVYWPGSLILLGSPSQRQSRELFMKVVDFLRDMEPETRPDLSEDNRLSLTLKNGSRVVSLPGTAATVRGYSAPDLIIEDEAAYFPDDGFYRAVRPMLAVSGGRLILLSTPNGKRGHFFEAWNGKSDEWTRVEVPADRCPRITKEFLDQERRALGEWWFKQEYFCEFTQTIDSVFRAADIERAFTDKVEPLFQDAPDNGVKPLFGEAV